MTERVDGRRRDPDAEETVPAQYRIPVSFHTALHKAAHDEGIKMTDIFLREVGKYLRRKGYLP